MMSTTRLVRLLSGISAAVLTVLTAVPVHAFSSGITTLNFGGTGCNQCHSGGMAPIANLVGPTKALPNSINTYTLTSFSAASETQDYGGFNVSALAGTLAVGGVAKKGTQALAGTGGRPEVTHNEPKRQKLGNVKFSFTWTAPASFSSVSLDAWANSVDLSGSNGGDAASMASVMVGTGAALCPPAPGSCQVPGKSALTIKDSDGKQAVSFKWDKGPTTSPMDFGDPEGSADYALCLYKDSTLAAEIVIPTSSLWDPTDTGFKYKNKDGLLQTAKLAAGDVAGNAKIQMKGKGNGIGFPASLPFIGATGVTAQVVNSDNANCWGDAYSGTELIDNTGETLKAKSPN